MRDPDLAKPNYHEVEPEESLSKIRLEPQTRLDSEKIAVEADAEKARRDDSWQSLKEANSLDFDRRSHDRKSPPRTSRSVKVQRFLNNIVYEIVGSRLYQILFVTLIFGSIGLIVFSATKRVELLEATYLNLGERGQLEMQILQLEQVWSEEQVREISAGIQNAEERTVFGDYQKLAVWLHEQGERARALDLELTYKLGSSERSLFDGMVEIPVALTVNPINPASESAYVDAMELLRSTVNNVWHIDIQSTKIASDGGRISMAVQLRVWVYGRVKQDG